MDKILGCCDLGTISHVSQSGTVPVDNLSVASISDNDSDKARESPLAPTAADKRREKKKPKRSRKRKAMDIDSEEDNDATAIRETRQQGEKISAFMESIQQTQSEQLTMMNQFMGSMLKILENQANNEK